MKGKALRKHSLHEEKTSSVLLKLFISGNEECHTTDAPLAHERKRLLIKQNDLKKRMWYKIKCLVSIVKCVNII